MDSAGRSKLVLVVGLGNPGREYAATRHNLGWLALDELVSRASNVTGWKKKFQGEYTKGTIDGRECVFLRPETYMNESGRSVQPARQFFHVAVREMIVLHDELDLPFADVRVKLGGGHAGHNGLRSLVQHLGTPDFVRVRMGVGRPPADFRGEVADYLLAGFTAVERASVPDIVQKGVEATLKVLAVGVERAMNEANSRPKRPGGQGASGASGSKGGSPAADPTPATPGKKGEGQDLARGYASRAKPSDMVSGGSLLQGIRPWGHRPRGDIVTWQQQQRRTIAPENTKPSMF
jgi:PTH1 family peptidyl-tRNA hydrolase